MSRTVLITGANRGIGLQFAIQYLAAGYKVIGTCRDSAKAKELCSLQNVRVEELDVASISSIKALKNKLQDEKIHLLINNAGVLYNEKFDELNYENVMLSLQVNSVGPLFITQTLQKNLVPGISKVVNITSRMGSIEDNTSGGYYGYRASKAALNMITKTLALEFKKEDIPVFAIHPGYVVTDMTGQTGDIQSNEAVERMIKLIDKLDESSSGNFFHREGQLLPY